MHGCTVQRSHCSHSKSHHDILRCTAQSTRSEWLRHLHLWALCQTSRFPFLQPLLQFIIFFFFNPPDHSSVLPIHNPQCFHGVTGQLLGWQDSTSVVYSSLLSSSANSAMMSCTQMSFSSCEVSTRKTVSFLSQGLAASWTTSSWATRGFFSTWFLKTMEASSDHCLGFKPARDRDPLEG